MSAGSPRPARKLAQDARFGFARRVLRSSLVFALLSAVALGSAPAAAAPKPAARRFARSIGAPNAGRLEGGVELKSTPAMRYLPSYENAHARFAMPQLVALLDRVSKHIQKRFPGSVMGLGHLSKRNGGDIDRHASHETGRDADVAFYAKDAKGKPTLLPSLTRFDRLGRAEGHPGVVFDDARNWEMIVALVNDPEVRVASLFVAPFLRARLLAHGVKLGTDAKTLGRVRAVLIQPKGALLHDDHVHVRIGCPAGMRECVEYAIPRRKRGAVTPGPTAKPAKKPAKKAPSAPAQAGQKNEKPAPDDDEPEGLDRLIGPSVKGWDSITVPDAPLYEPAR